jgi:hypothetical protein
MASRDDDVKQALGQVAKLGGFQIKRMATTDDLKDHTITITITRTSEGWHQERLQFEDEPQIVATVDGNNGHVDSVEILDPDVPGGLIEAAGEVAGVIPEPETITAGVTPPADEIDPKPDIHLVGEAAAAARKRR